MRFTEPPYDEQPQELTEIDWGNPLASGLVGVINAAALPAAQSNTVVQSGNAYGDIRPREHGLAHVASAAFSRISVRTTRRILSAGTVAFVGNLRATGSGDFAFAAAVGNLSNGNVVFGFQQGDNATKPRGFMRVTASASQTTAEIAGSNSTGADIPTTHAWALRYDGTTAMRIFRDGVDVTASNDVTAASGAATGLDLVCIGGERANTPSSPRPGVGEPAQHCYLVVAWDRALSAEEIAEWSRNPWQLFRARQVVLPASAAPSADVAGSVALGLTATGSIAVAKPVSGTVAVALATSGSIAVAKPVAGGVGLALSATGAIAVNKTVAGAVAMGVACSGALTIPKPVAGSVAVGLTAAGSVAVAKPVAGAVAMALTTSGALTTVGMGGAVAVSVATAGSVAVAKPVSGAVLVSLTTAAALTIAKPVSGAVVLSLTTTGRIETATLRGLVTAVLTLRSTPTTLTLRPTDATLTTRAGAAALTLRPAADAALQFQTDDPV